MVSLLSAILPTRQHVPTQLYSIGTLERSHASHALVQKKRMKQGWDADAFQDIFVKTAFV